MEKLGNSGKFIIEPLSPGYGVTIGNSLRRVLLSSLAGAAITSVKIEGASHEFSTLPGVREDVVEIILNLKRVNKVPRDNHKKHLYPVFKNYLQLTATCNVNKVDNNKL